MANLSSNPVILRNNKKREKRSIYSRYFKEFSFKSIPGCGSLSLPSELVSVSNTNMNISNKTGHTAPVRSSAGGMFRNKTYADQVRELLRTHPMHTSEDRTLTRHSVNQSLLSSWSHASFSNQHTRLYRKLCSNGFLCALHTLETVPAQP